ncbi:hypothetical protein ACQ4PT_072203 [Festuca glaucescens]
MFVNFWINYLDLTLKRMRFSLLQYGILAGLIQQQVEILPENGYVRFLCSFSPLTQITILKASDRFNINSQLEHLQAKYVGTGHADLTRFEWAVNIQRDSYASYIGHYPMLAYFSIAENESIGRERFQFMQKMLLPCGLPPERDED